MHAPHITQKTEPSSRESGHFFRSHLVGKFNDVTPSDICFAQLTRRSYAGQAEHHGSNAAHFRLPPKCRRKNYFAIPTEAPVISLRGISCYDNCDTGIINLSYKTSDNHEYENDNYGTTPISDPQHCLSGVCMPSARPNFVSILY